MSKATRLLKRSAGKLWNGILYVWDRPIIISAVLFVAAILLFNLIIDKTFIKYASCQGLIVDALKANAWNAGTTFCNIIGNDMLNPWLGWIRNIVAWIIVIFFAFLSLFLTILSNRFITIIRFLTLNKEEWKRFMASIRIWLLLFVAFGSIFYFTVIR
jgi:hypothetical protein